MSKQFNYLLANALEQKLVEEDLFYFDQEEYGVNTKQFSIEDANSVISILGLTEKRPFITTEMLLVGMNVELEHGTKCALTNITNDDPVITAKIAITHLDERLDYYELLDRYVEQKSTGINV